MSRQESGQEKIQRKKLKRIILKIGTSVLTTSEEHFSLTAVNRLVEDTIRFRSNGGELILVSSGAIACGMDTLKIQVRPKALPDLQACAAIGQSKLMKAYEDAFSRHSIHTGQILLTRDAFHDRLRYLNVRNTVNALLKRGVVPIVNENDTVSTDEIRFGDNDMLAALMATVVQPDLLILFSDVSGLLDKKTKERVSEIASVKDLDHAIQYHVIDVRREHTVGGMQAKLAAVRVAMQSGVSVVLASGKKAGMFNAIIAGEDCGTRFLPALRMKARKQWLAHNARVKGTLMIDRGASCAIAEGGKSLLASGIQRIEGQFEAGDLVSIALTSGHEMARGLVNYSSEEIKSIMGKKSSEIRIMLKSNFFEEVIHRDNLAILSEVIK